MDKTIRVTPRAASFLAALATDLAEAKADHERAEARIKEERRRALDESRDPGCHPCGRLPKPPEMSEDDLAARALEIGLATMLRQVTDARLGGGGRHHPLHGAAPIVYDPDLLGCT